MGASQKLFLSDRFFIKLIVDWFSLSSHKPFGSVDTLVTGIFRISDAIISKIIIIIDWGLQFSKS